MTPQYYHSNVRTWAEPQGAVDHVDDSSHLHLWLKLYFSLFPSISPFTLASWKNWRLMNLVYSLASNSVWTSFALFCWNRRNAIWAVSCEKFFQATETLSREPWLSLVFRKPLYSGTCLRFFILFLGANHSSFRYYHISRIVTRWKRACMHGHIHLDPHHTHADFIQTVENIPNDRLTSSGWSPVRKIVRVWCISGW